jgi:ribonuclease HI
MLRRVRKLDDYFNLSPAGPTPSNRTFNPFETEIFERMTEKRSEPVQAALARASKLENLLDAPASAPAAEAAPLVLFPKPRQVEEVVPSTPDVPMVQPRSKEGQRLLYKYPNIPRVGVKGAYSLLVGQSDRSQTAWLLQFDGAANPNPGPASSGAVLWSPPDLEGKRTVVYEIGKFLGKATNNIAEAQGILLGLQIAAARGARELLIEGDSELIIFQHTGQYKVKDKNIKVWWSEAQAAMMDETCFDWIAIRQVPREFNERADSITKEVLSRKSGFTRA